MREQSAPALALCKMQFSPSLCSVNTTFTLTIDQQCFWTLSLETSKIRPEHCHLLAEVGFKLSSVDAEVELLLALDQSIFCVGNSDSKFVQLSEHHKGVFKDQLGKLMH